MCVVVVVVVVVRRGGKEVRETYNYPTCIFLNIAHHVDFGALEGSSK